MRLERAARLVGQSILHPGKTLRIIHALNTEDGSLYRATIPFGDTMYVMLPDQMSILLYMNERYEPEVTAFMEQVLEPGLTVLDVGAHIGYHSLVARRFVGDSGKVVCFEPTPSTYEVLRRNCLHFPTMVLENIAINDGSTPTIDLKDYGTMYAAWNTSLEPRMTDREKRYLPKPRIVTVAAASIDAYCQQYRNIKPDFIKLDIENGEMAALIGAKDTISRCAPAIVFEGGDLARTDDNDTRACIDYLASTFGYSCFEFNFRYKTVVPHYPKPKGTYRGSYNILALPLER